MNIKYFIIFSSMCLYFCVASFTNEQLDDMYDAIEEYAIATASVQARFCLIENRVEMKQKILQDTKSSDAVNFGLIKKPLGMKQKISEDTKALDALFSGIIKKYEELNQNLIEANQSIDLIFNDFPDIRLPIEEFKEKMNNIKELLNISNLTDEILDEIYSTLREDAANNSIKFYIFEKLIEDPERVIGFKIEKIPDIYMSKEELKKIMNAKIENLTEEHHQRIFEKIIHRSKGCVTKLSIQGYLYTKTIGSNDILSIQEIEYGTKSLPSDIHMSKEKFKELMQAKIKNLTKEQIEKIYAAVQKDNKGCVTKLSVKNYLHKKSIEWKHIISKQEIEYLTKSLPSDISMSKEVFQESMKTIIRDLTNKQLEKMYDVVQKDDKGYVTKLSVEHYLHKKSIEWKYIPSKQEIEYLTKDLPSVACLTKSRFKDEIKKDEILEEIYAGAQSYLANDLKPLSEWLKSGTFYRSTIIQGVLDYINKEELASEHKSKLSSITNEQLMDVTETLPEDIRMSKKELKELIKKPKFTDAQLNDIYDAVLKDAKSSYPVKVCIIEKFEDRKHVLLESHLTCSQFPDIRLPKEEFEKSMRLNKFDLPDMILDEIYYTLQKDAAENLVCQLYITERNLAQNKVPKIDIGFKTEKIPNISMSEQKFQETMKTIIRDLTDKQLKTLYEVVQKDDKGYVTKLSVEDYLRKKSIGSKHILSEREIEYVTKKLPSDIRMSKVEFKEIVNKQSFKFTDVQLDFVYNATKRHVDELYKAANEYGEKVDRDYIERYLADNLSKYNGLTIYRVQDVVNDLPPAKHLMSISEFIDKFDYGLFTSRG
ncbi:uncharacterized protein LOC126833396 isoform X5 [Adelges cooleyi]|uniref:uncharacterized protein LOC126833396 isoform X4 n=1 Tax=Adelges cooleyi TaxID=133065 RepID=UPI0021808164|nr:uncharacterized protein LOC126833396 isoform X4 [Adelges cooleyi]XP_050420696.1 uncharacterized protein LOC126833396 isoform X5 [Adelges cooleyi]